MKAERKIKMMVSKVSFKEAEDADDVYWARQSAENRLLSLIDLRATFFTGKKIK